MTALYFRTGLNNSQWAICPLLGYTFNTFVISPDNSQWVFNTLMVKEVHWELEVIPVYMVLLLIG